MIRRARCGSLRVARRFTEAFAACKRTLEISEDAGDRMPWFAELTNRKLRRSAHRSVTDLETGIRKWINEWNKNPKPFVWTKSAEHEKWCDCPGLG
ncbi:MAG: hypothetical protein ABSF03_29510 [Streptosporangiaceae bacterium]